MKKLYSIIIFCAICVLNVNAQVSQGGAPTNWQQGEVSVGFERLPALEMASIEAEDAENDQYKEFAYRFGIERTTNFNTSNSGNWTIEDGYNVWRFGVEAPNAKAVSFVFTEFNLPKGAMVYVYDVEQTHFIGGFNQLNKQANGMLATSLVYGDKVIVELSVPESRDLSTLDLTIGQIVHAYRGLDSEFEALKNANRGPFGNSGSCNINVNCPEGDDWQVEKQSVALIVSGGFASCSGALINNTANDGHPYFLTANHCLGGGVGNWVFYFNHESATCNGNNGPTNQSVSGATLIANSSGSDFGLLEINNGNTIPSSYNPQWAGWDNSDNENAVSSATGIHHPSGDVKKICHEEDAPYHDNVQGAAVWYIDQWEEGMTEGGSSGSPLFNQDHRIIGQLYGGFASCQNQGGADWYGRLGVAWDGNSASSRLRDWLDPSNSTTVLDGYPIGAVTLNLDAGASGLEDVPEALCTASMVQPTFVLRNNGTTTLTAAVISYTYNGGAAQTINWSGSLSQNQTEDVQLGGFTPQNGTNTIEVEIISANGQSDENSTNNSESASFDFLVGQQTINISITTDDYGYETYWELRGPNNQVIASGGNTEVGLNGGGDQSAQAGDPGAYGNNVTINETVQFWQDGCYEFIIVDDYGDGICCDFGNGSYEIRDANNVLLASGGGFDEEEETEFGMANGLSVVETELGGMTIYPNPTEGTLNINIQNIETLNQINVTDITGRILLSSTSFDTQTTLELGNLTNGLYHVNLVTDNGIATRKVILSK